MIETGQFYVDFVKGVLANNGRIVAARFSLQRGFLREIEPLFFLTLEQNGVRSLQEFPWTPELEKYLLFELRLKMSSFEEEVERFAAILFNNFETAERDFGRDFTRAVLIEILRSRPEYALGEWLAAASTYSPSHTSSAYANCSQFLRQSIDGLQNTASIVLGYDPDTSVSLMTSALGLLLDEVFHISARKALFPK